MDGSVARSGCIAVLIHRDLIVDQFNAFGFQTSRLVNREVGRLFSDQKVAISTDHSPPRRIFGAIVQEPPNEQPGEWSIEGGTNVTVACAPANWNAPNNFPELIQLADSLLDRLQASYGQPPFGRNAVPSLRRPGLGRPCRYSRRSLPTCRLR